MTKPKLTRLMYKSIRILIGFIRLFSSFRYQKCFHLYLKWIGINTSGNLGYIHPNIFIDEVDYSALTICDHVVISRNVTLLVHDYSISSSIESLFGEIKTKFIVKPIIINRNAFIGANVTILPGSIIGENCIIGAGSVLKGTIPANSVAFGNPCISVCSVKEYYDKQMKFNKSFIY